MQSRLSLGLSDNQRMDLARAIKTGRKNKGLTQEQLGEKFGVSKAAVAQWESGKNMPDPRKLAELMKVLGLDAQQIWGVDMQPRIVKSTGELENIASRSGSGTASAFVPASVPLRDEMAKDVPVLGTTVGGQRGDFSMNAGDPVDYVRRPPRISGRSDVFALYVQGTSMAPWRQPGELVYVEANRAPQNGDYVVIELKPDSDGQDRPAYIKRLVAVTSTKIKVQQYSPARVFEIDRRKVGRMLRVMDWSELLGV